MILDPEALSLRSVYADGYNWLRGAKTSLRPRCLDPDMPTDSRVHAKLNPSAHEELQRNGVSLQQGSRQRLAHIGGALGAVVLSVLVAAGFLVGCDASDVARPMMPAPIVMKDQRSSLGERF